MFPGGKGLAVGLESLVGFEKAKKMKEDRLALVGLYRE